MKEWWTARELAAARLPGLPTTRRGVQFLAGREGWAKRVRSGSGGGFEYPSTALPGPARDELVRRQLAEGGRQEVTPLPIPPPQGGRGGEVSTLKAWQRRCMEARLGLLAEVDRLAALLGGPTAARRRMVELARAGELPAHLQGLVAAAHGRRGSARVLSQRSLVRWARLRATGGAVAVAPALPRRETSPPSWLWPVMRAWARPGKPPLAAACEWVAGEGVDLPPLRTVQRRVAQLGAVERMRGRMGPRALKAIRPYVVRDFAMLEPADVYMADGHTHDQQVLHPWSGRPFRPEIVSVIDVATRRVVGWSAGVAESAWLVADALRHAAAAAVPAIFYSDRGTGFCNQHLDDAVTGVLARLGTTHETSLPYNSQARGVVERLHQSLWIRAARLHPGFVGHDMDREARMRLDRRVRDDLKACGTTRALLGWQDFMGWCGAQVAAYNARPHTSLARVRDPESGRLRHRSPDEAWAAAVEGGAELAVPDAATLGDLFRPQIERVVRRGMVRLGQADYGHALLEEHHGRIVLVGYDIHDPSRVWVRDGEQRLICIAELDAWKRDFYPRPAVEQARERREQAQLRRIEDKAEALRAERRGPTPAIALLPPPEPDPEGEARFVAEWQAEQDAPPQETAEDRYVAWRRVGARIEAGEAVPGDMRRWHGTWPESPEGRSMLRNVEEWGEDLILLGWRMRQAG